MAMTTSGADGDDLIRGLRASTPVMLGFIPFALVLGAQAAAKGFTALETPLMTGLNFGGGSEFAAVSLWTSPPHLLLILGVTLLVNSRHLVMGAALAPHMRLIPRRIALPSLFFMCDESWAMGLSDAQRRERDGHARPFSLRYFWGVSLGLWATWVVFTTTGAVIGPRLGDITAYGFDLAFPAVFFVLLRGMWKGVGPATPWAVSLVTAVIVDLTAPGAWYVPAGIAAGLLTAWLQVRK